MITMDFIRVLILTTTIIGGVPIFDPTANLRNVLVPMDAAVDSIIYRLRASDPDFDYPLHFSVDGEASVVAVDSLNCTRLNSVCQANVLLRRRLEAGRFYDFRVIVTSFKRRQRAAMDCSFRATNASTSIGDIFPGAPTLLMVSEAARRNSELGSLVARGSILREKPVVLELWGSPLFGLRQRVVGQRDAEGTVVLKGPLDYETRSVHHLTILANDPWMDPSKDTRNIATWPLLVAVLDEQDTPPVFTQAPPTTQLPPELLPGDVILRVQAEDGDRGKPRDIRYGLVPEGSPFVHFFNLSEDTGELRLTRPLLDIQAISHSNTPIILTVVAEEVRSNADEAPAQSSTVKLALIPPMVTSPAPHFNKAQFLAVLDRNASVGTQLDLDMELIGTMGMIYTLKVADDNGTFDVIPNVIEGRSKFVVKVRNTHLLEAEQTLRGVLVAQELGDGNATTRADLIVEMHDLKDNAPEFMQKVYRGEVLENAEIGTTVVRVRATNKEQQSTDIRYSLNGSTTFAIEEKTGVITLAHSDRIDAETEPQVMFTATARNLRDGATSTATVLVDVLDVNDETPVFEKPQYEFIVDQTRRHFTLPAFVAASDADTTAPNNQVRYELVGPQSNLSIDAVSGEVTITGQWNHNEVVNVKARAYDNGVPRLWSECDIRLYPPETEKTYQMLFVVSDRHRNRKELEDYLSDLIGGRVVVDRLRQYRGDEPQVLDVTERSEGDKSVAETTVTFPANSVIDIERIKDILYKKEEDRKATLKSATTGGVWDNLWWLLLLLLLLLLLSCLVLVLCCVLEGCPLYVAPVKRKRRVSPVDIEKVVLVKDQIEGEVESVPPPAPAAPMENRSVQVAEWFGRREAWTPEHNANDESDSLRRHEMDRGSERGRKREYYIREGGADILRLVTRGPPSERGVTLLPEQAYLIDGKDILMRRYIDQQQQQQMQQNTLNRIQTEHELLEESLRQQNLLLRQVLMERERDFRLETQSLPAGTQTDQHVSTQTELVYMRPPARQTRSDNDATTDDDDEDHLQRRSAKKRVHHKTVKRKIRTPIEEEGSEHEATQVRKNSEQLDEGRKYSETRSSILRQMRAEAQMSGRSLRKEVLQEISDSLNQSESEEERIDGEVGSTPINRTASGRRKSENDLDVDVEEPPSGERVRGKAVSQQDLSRYSVSSQSRIPLGKQGKHTARYMEWYKPKTTRSAIANEHTKSKLPKPVTKKARGEIRNSATKVSKKMILTRNTVKGFVLPTAPGPEHPLIQHSKNRFESSLEMPKVVKVARKPKVTSSNISGEGDVDSGIALTMRPPMALKKSVFTIAYDDMATRQLPESFSTTP